MTSHEEASRHKPDSGLLSGIARVRSALSSYVDEQTSHALALFHIELRRVGHVLALSIAAAFFVCASAAFAALAVAIALWDSHRILATAIIACALGSCAYLCVHLISSQTQDRSGE